jgi:hypothetical protein
MLLWAAAPAAAAGAAAVAATSAPPAAPNGLCVSLGRASAAEPPSFGEGLGEEAAGARAAGEVLGSMSAAGAAGAGEGLGGGATELLASAAAGKSITLAKQGLGLAPRIENCAIHQLLQQDKERLNARWVADGKAVVRHALKGHPVPPPRSFVSSVLVSLRASGAEPKTSLISSCSAQVANFSRGDFPGVPSWQLLSQALFCSLPYGSGCI